MAIPLPPNENLIALVVATFNAPPGAQFLQDFFTEIEAGMSLQTLADILVTTDEFKNGILKGAVANEKIAGALLENFGLTAGNTDPFSPDAQAEAYFNDRLEQGASISDVIIEAGTYLLGNPVEAFQPAADLFHNKIIVADVYSRKDSANDLAQLQSILIGVTAAGPKTESEAEGYLSLINFPHPDPTFFLTNGVDNPATSNDNDEINGVVDNTTPTSSTLTDGDNVDGKAGFDTANFVIVTNSWPTHATIKDFEKIVFTNVNAGTTDLNLSNVTGATELWNSGAIKGSILNLNNIQNNAAIGALNVDKGTTQNATFKDGTISTGGTVTLAFVSSGGSTARMLETVGHATTANTAKDVTLSLIAEGPNFVQFSDGANSIGGLSTIKIAGGGSLDIVATDGEFNNVTTVDASGNTGGVTFDLTSHNKDIKFIGGAGNDTLTLGNFTATDSIDGGEIVDKEGKSSDNDTLIASLANLQSITKAGSVKNVENLGITLEGPLATNTTVNAELFGIGNITIHDAFVGAGVGKDTLNLTNLANHTQVTFNSSSAAAGTIGINVKGAIVGIDEAATLFFDKGVDLNTNKVSIKADGVETITVATDATSGAGAKLNKLADTALTTLKVTGSDGIGIGDLSASKNITTLDATGVVKDAFGAVGGLFMDLSKNDKSVTFTGGQGDDAYIASSNGDIITGGLGGDLVFLGTAADKLLYNAQAESNGITTKDSVSNFDVTADSIQFAANMQKGSAAYIGGNSFTNTDSTQVRFDDAAQTLQVDLNGDGAADMGITLVGINAASFGTTNFSFA
ncbi:beta strand repeat-containing protein [Nitrosomonas communis]|uniref:Uncharacterized protein n=1 Tax=Nitrosomonas communis TaxID=44574 RepID=A0A1I4QT66_9PROT|nr:hypothetical protein [Nitrosomonas communis]SFM42903.1 hypothetical protein SAMN05421863_102831 [Nitrosomonas communis]